MKTIISSKSRFLIGTAIIFAILNISNSCTKSSNMYNMGSGTGTKGGSGGPGTNEVWIQNMAFLPSTITITGGTTITWTNKDPMAHTVTSDKGLFDSGPISSAGAYSGGGTWSNIFNNPGIYPYHCSIHTTMTATVIVN